MARPAKAINTSTQKISKQERNQREIKEKDLRGNNDKIKPFRYLNKRQKQIFKFLMSNLNQEILGNLDVYVLNQTAITIERLETIEKTTNEEGIEFLLDKSVKSMRDMYSKDFFRYCNELSLSPQARAKLSIAVQPPEKKSLLEMLNEDNDE